METPEKIPLEEALARGLIACTTCGAKGPGVKRAGEGFACEACAPKKGGRAVVGAAVAGGLLLIGWAAWLLRPAPMPMPDRDPAIAEAQQLIAKQRYAEARDRLQARMSAGGADPALSLYLGTALFKLNHVEEALPRFREAGTADPAVAPLAELWTGVCLQKLGYAAEALPFLEKPIGDASFDEGRRDALAEALLDLERYDDALKLLPATNRDAVTLFHRHRALRYGGKAAEADALVASLDPRERWTLRVSQLREEGDFAGARALAAEVKPRSAGEAARLARARLSLALEEGTLPLPDDPAADPADRLWFRAAGQLLEGRRADAEKTAAEFLSTVDPKAAGVRQYRIMMELVAGRRSPAELEAEAKRLNRFHANDLHFILALATGDKARAAKGLEATPGRNFPYHALTRLAGR